MGEEMIKKTIFIQMIAVTLLVSFVVLLFLGCEKAETPKEQATQVPESVYNDRTPMDLLKLLVKRHTLEVKEGEYIQGTWEEVKASKPPEGLEWIYPRGVTLYGLLTAYDILKDDKIIEYVKKHNEVAARQYEYLVWQEKTYGKYVNDAKMWQLMTLSMLDHCGALTAQIMESILNYGVKPTPQLKVVIERVADYMANKQPRLHNGAFWRPLLQWKELLKTLWIDDLYMSCPFLVRWYQYTGDQSFLEDAVNQVLRFAEYTQDKDGVLFHGFLFQTNEASPYKWSRGNGWAMVGTAEVLSAMPENHPEFDKVLTILRNHINGIIKLQDESGLWHQVLDHPEVWLETSCTAMFAYSIARAVNRGWVDKNMIQIVEKALQGVNSKITKDGAMLDIGKGTNIGFDLQYYIDRDRPYDDFHGHGAVILALTEFINAKEMLQGE